MKSDRRFTLTPQEHEELFSGLANEIADEAEGIRFSSVYRQRLLTEPTEFERQAILNGLAALSRLTDCDAFAEWMMQRSGAIDHPVAQSAGFLF